MLGALDLVVEFVSDPEADERLFRSQRAASSAVVAARLSCLRDASVPTRDQPRCVRLPEAQLSAVRPTRASA